MSDQAAENPVEGQAPEKTEEQLLEEQKQREQEERAKEEERKRLEEEARAKMEEDMKKLDEALKGSLQGIGKTFDNRTLVNTKLMLAQKQLERVFPSILKLKHVQHIDINTNALTDATILADFPNLLTINLSKNQIENLGAFKNPQKLMNLQFLDLTGNKLKQLTYVALPSLKKLTLTENQIASVGDWKPHHSIEILELRKNKLKKLKNLNNMKALKQLYICENELTDLRGLENVPALWKLSVRANKLTKIMSPFPFLPALRYLNLRENQIGKMEELKKIDIHINDINLLGNPITQQLGEEAKRKIIESYPHILRVNKGIVTEEQRIEFEKKRLEEIQEREKAKAAEEAEGKQ